MIRATLLRALVPRMLLALGVGVLVLALIEGVEQAERLGEGLWTWLVGVALRLPTLGRELLPLGLGVGLAAGVAGLRARGELVALGAAGVAPRRIWAVGVGACGVLGLALGLGTEGVLPWARDARVARALGSGAAGDGGWGALPGGLVQARWGPEGLEAVTVVRRNPNGEVERLDVVGLRPTPGGWEAREARRVRLRAGVQVQEDLEPAVALAELPPPRALAVLARALSPAELSLDELGRSPLPSAAGWLRWRRVLLVAPTLLGAALAALALRWPLSPPQAAALAGLGVLGWQLLGLAVVEGAAAGWAPLALLLLAAGVGARAVQDQRPPTSSRLPR